MVFLVVSLVEDMIKMQYKIDKDFENAYVGLSPEDDKIELKAKIKDQITINPGDTISFDTGISINIPKVNISNLKTIYINLSFSILSIPFCL